MENTLEIFQIWLNLPASQKMTPPDFKMLWTNEIPRIEDRENKFHLSLINGTYGEKSFYNAPKQSWASDPNHRVNIFLVKIEPNGKFTLPATDIEKSRMLYHFEGNDIVINNEPHSGKNAFNINPEVELTISTQKGCELLILDACPLKEPVFQHGPFVMNTRDEIYETFSEYQKTQFGGWSWSRADMVHGPKIERFAKYPDGTIRKPKENK